MAKNLEIVHPHAAGIDIGSRSFFVDAGDDEVKVFPTYTEGCLALRDYLMSKGITTVAMESTGVYWIILYGILEEAAIEVSLVNGRDVKNVPGRKSDIKDCQWLRQLHSYGLLKKSFIPDSVTRELRNYMRLRQDHIRSQTTQVHLMQKALTQMNIRLTEVISDIMGASGSRMIAAILNGERKAETLVELCEASILKTKRELVIKALEGTYRDEHLFALKHAYQTWHYYQGLINECDKKVDQLLQEHTRDKEDVEIRGKRKNIRYNRPQIDNLPQHLLKLTDGKDPIGIAGITDYTFLQLLSEIGANMQPWSTEKHFISWLKLAPVKSSSGKMQKRHVVKRTNKAGLIFRNAAQSMLTSKHTALSQFAKRIKAKRGSAVAIKAIARKMACYYYRVMTKGVAFLDKGMELYKQQQEHQKQKYLERMALKMNLKLVPA